MANDDQIDVLVPAFNVEETVEASLTSILNQSHKDIRVIIVDDGSTDRTPDILKRLSQSDRRIQFVSKENGGIVSALTLALSLSDTSVVARHDADDFAYPDRLEKQLAYLREHPDCVAVGANARQINGVGKQIGVTSLDGDVRPNADVIPSIEPYLMHPFLLARRSAINAVGGYRYALHCEDSDLYWRLLDQGRLHNLSAVLGDYRIHQGGVSSASVQNGRIGAVYSQLATLSYRRRRNGHRDFSFPARAYSETKSLRSVGELVRYVSDELDDSEVTHLTLAATAKLLENAVYRHFLLEESDCRDIAQALPAILSAVPPHIGKKIVYDRVYVAHRLLKAGKFREIRALNISSTEYVKAATVPARERLAKLKRHAAKLLRSRLC